jgi:NitT/TauT family transport system substrate-binding protein
MKHPDLTALTSGGGLDRRDFLRLAVAANLAAAATACAPKESEPPLRIGYLPITDATPLLIGHALNFFQNQGLAVEKPVLMRSWPSLADAFLGGSFDVVHLLLPIPIYLRFSQKQRVKIVAWNHTNGSALTVAARQKLRGFSDLKGKQIAIPHWYSMHNIILQLGLRKAGLEVVMQDREQKLGPTQVNLFVMAPPDMPTALSSGAIDGYIVAEPFNAAGEVLAHASILRFTGDVFRDHPCCVVVMKEDMIEKHPAWAQKVLNGIVDAEKWVLGNLDRTAHILSKDGGKYLPMPETIIKRAMTKYDVETYGAAGTGAIVHPDWNSRRIGFEPYPYPSATREIVQLLKQTKVQGDTAFLRTLDPERVVNELFDYTLVKRAIERAGGMAQFGGTPQSPYARVEQIAP